MPVRPSRSVHLADVTTLAVALGQDEQLPQAQRAARDRRASLRLPDGSDDRTVLGLRWLELVRSEDRALDQLHGHVRQSLAWAQTGLFAAGLLSGWLAALGVLYYDGSSRINVVALIGVLVLLPGLFLFAFVLAALPSGAAARLPFASALGGIARAFSPGRLALLARRFLPAELRQSWATIAGALGRHQTLYQNLQRWALLRGSQLFALGFQFAALTAALALVVFSDLAFGWSTTLTSGDPARDAARVHTLTATSATPWSWAWPAAVPSPELVAESRYYRAAAAQIDAQTAARLGGWWPFVVLFLLVYGLLPRVVTVLLAGQRMGAAARFTFFATPGLTAILHRLHRAHLATTAAEPENERPAAADRGPASAPATTALAAEGPPRAVVNWAGIQLEDAALSQAFGRAPVHPAGGERSLAADHELVQSLARAASGDDRSIVIAVKAWEPPLLEFTDFLRSLRTALGAGCPLVVVPLSLNGEGPPQPPPEASLQIWQNKLRPLGDPWLRVLPFAPEVTS